MFPQIPVTLNWRASWEPLEDSGKVFVIELRKELASDHILVEVCVRAVARHVGSNDVLFATDNPANPIAVVHLMWTSHPEPNSEWSHTTLYKNLEDWIERCLNPDHYEYLKTGNTEVQQ